MSRFVSLDVFRGMTIAAMIVVNNPGSWSFVYPPLLHAKWHGWTPTDLIFPFFIFIMGVSISLALSRRIESGDMKAVYGKIVRRTLILFFLGIGLHLFHRPELATLRIPGVLQRIALCYCAASLIFIKSGWKNRVILTTVILAAYFVLMKWVPVPGFGAGDWSLEGNLCGHIDRMLLGSHLYRGIFDPEGLLSTLPALATALMGTLCGDWIRIKGINWNTFREMLAAGLFLTASGLVLQPIFPINKQLWTTTFVLFSGGAALICLAILAVAVDLRGLKKWAWPLRVYGTNAIAVFVGSSLMVKLLTKISIGGEEGLSLWAFIYGRLLAPWAGDYFGSLLFPMILILFWLALLTPFYKRGFYLKI